MEEELAPPSMILPTLEGMLGIEEHLEARGHENTQTLELKDFYKIQLKVILEELASRKEECQTLQEWAMEDSLEDLSIM